MPRTTITSHRSRYSYAETVERLSAAIAAGGNTIFATIDQAAAARSAGTTLRPTTLIVFGNPKGGTPLMAAFPLTALDLPLKLVVYEEESGAVNVVSASAAELAERYGVTGFDDLLAAMDRGLAALGASVAS
jgi:uncharacterized protein (DUF302 family)